MLEKHRLSNVLLMKCNNRHFVLIKLRLSYCFLFLFFICCMSFLYSPEGVSGTIRNPSDYAPQKLIDYLQNEKIDLIHDLNATTPIVEPSSYNELLKKVKENQALLTLVRVKLINLDNFLSNQRRHQKVLSNKLKKAVLNPNDLALQAEVSTIENLSTANTKIIDLVTENTTLAHRYELALISNGNQLETWKIKQEGIRRFEQLQHDIETLYADRNLLIERNVKLQEANKSNQSFNQTFEDALNIQINNQNIILINDKVSEFELQIRLIKSDNLLLKQNDIKTTLSSIDLYKDAIEQLSRIKQSLIGLQKDLKDEGVHSSSQETKDRILLLEKKSNEFLNLVIEREKKLTNALDLRQQTLKQQLSSRQTLSTYQENSWLSFKNEFIHMPDQIASYFSNLGIKFYEGYARLSVWSFLFLLSNIIILLVAAYIVNRKLKILTQDKLRIKPSAQLYDSVLTLVAHNVWQITSFMILLLLCKYMQIQSNYYVLFIDLFSVWFVFRNLIIITRFILISANVGEKDNSIRLFYYLKKLLIFGEWTTLFMVFSKQLPLSIMLQDILTRLFMFFIFATSIFLWFGKDIFPILIRPLLKSKKRYLRNAISLLFILLPITLFTTAIIGLVGYMNLAWSMSRYQANLVIVMIVYVLARGLFSDLLEILSDWMQASLRNGWLWVEVFLKPFDRIIHLVLFLISVLFLFQLFGIYTEMPVFQWLDKLGSYVLVNVSGVHITLISVVQFCLVLSVFFWMAKWTREFCFRWVYRNTRDEGIRNSLSVFTQYAVILFGGYITLRVLGLDFSGMSMILGGLAVGMGFGLRDFANNIVGGIMLLIERPVREGDLITLGGHEGKVAHIGIRSMRVSSWDNTEVLIPNAETFNKPFINWTHQDSIVRTVVPIKVRREDDPVLVQELILEVLNIVPEIMDDPPTQVLLKKVDDALLEFEVRYFINIQIYSRFEIRSKFLFALLAQFKAAGINPPIPLFNVELKDTEGHHVFTKEDSRD